MISPAFAESHRAVKAGAINELVEKGGRGSCKSSYISLEIILLILKNPLIHACVFRKYGNTLRTTVYTQIVWAIAQLGLTRKFRCTVSPMECTYLPTGAVIPPNREFLAVLGDQKQGTNIETPLDTMVQAFRQALSEGGYSGQSTAYLVIDEDVLGKVVYRLNRSESNRVGVSLEDY